MIIDFHTHTFPSKIAGRAITTLAGNSHTKAFLDGTDESLAASMKQSGIDCSVILPVATSDAQIVSINDSAERLQEVRRKSGLISFGAMHPDFEDWKSELLHLKNTGIKGIKLHPVYQNVDLDDIRMLRIYDRCAELGLMVVLHAGFDVGFPGVDRCAPSRSLHALRELAFPSRNSRQNGFRFILAHMGGWHQWDEVLRLAPEFLEAGPVLLDTAFSCGSFTSEGKYWKPSETRMLDSQQFMAIVRAFGTERILFATDSPWSDQEESLKWMRSLPLTKEELDAILGENARKLLEPRNQSPTS